MKQNTVPTIHSSNQVRKKRVRGAVQQVLELYKMGVTPREIALRVYGCDDYRFRQRVFSIIYWYGKRLGLLNTVRNYDQRRGEYIDVETGTVIGLDVKNGFIPHSSPVHPQDPFLGSYQTMQQLRASLPPSDRRVVDILSHVDRMIAVLPGISRESVIRQDACLLARINAGLDAWLIKIALSSIIISLLYHVPQRVHEFIEAVQDVYNHVDPMKALRECLEKGFKIPRPLFTVLVTRAVAILNGGT